MNALRAIAVDTDKLNARLARVSARSRDDGSTGARCRRRRDDRAAKSGPWRRRDSRAARRRGRRGARHRRRAHRVRQRLLAARDGLERARVLLKTADLIDRDRELLALLDTLECGKPIAQARRRDRGRRRHLALRRVAGARAFAARATPLSALTGWASFCGSRSASSRSSRRGIFRC